VAASIVAALKAALPSGGYLIMYEGTDTDPRQREATGSVLTSCTRSPPCSASPASPWHTQAPLAITRPCCGGDQDQTNADRSGTAGRRLARCRA